MASPEPASTPHPHTPPTPLPAQTVAPVERTGPFSRWSARRQPVVVDAREWRMRTETRANGMLFAGMMLLVSASFATRAWAGWATLGLGVAVLVASALVRPALPMRSPGRRIIDPEDAAVMTPAFPSFPASPPHGWAAPDSPYASPPGVGPAGPPAARLPRELARERVAAPPR